VMSATLDVVRVSALLDGAPVIESQGRTHPVDTVYLGRNPAERIEEAVVRATTRALGEQAGSILVFLPGQGEIRRVHERLAERVRDPGVILAPLYGALDRAEQDRAIAPAPAGRRKVVLATSIAETSLTIEGVRVVIDSGLSRAPRFDPASGLTRLVTVPVARASADQRRGRAGRTEPGVCYRLWDEAQTRGLVPHARPEILEADLSGFALDLARWGAKSAEGLALLDPPPAGAFAEARALLGRIGALDAAGALTPHGRRIAALPLPPRLAHMVAAAADAGAAATGAAIAAVLSERGLGGDGTDLRDRLGRLARDGSPRAKEARALAGRWARAAGGGTGGEVDPGLILAEAFADRIARARGKPGEFLLASRRGACVEPTDALARERWLAVAELGGGDARDRIRLAAPVDEAALLDAFADRLETEDRLEPDSAGRLRARRLRRLGAIVVEEQPLDRPPPGVTAAAPQAEVERKGLSALPWGEASRSLRDRVRFLRALDPNWPDWSEEGLTTLADQWLTGLLNGRRALGEITDQALADALRGLLPWDLQRRLDAEAPERFEAPTGTRARIDYGAEAGPTAEIRVQELFGLSVHPTIAGGRVPLTLALLSPARRPVQVTRDLPGFWKGSWAAVRAEMRGRYPKHPWPEDPASAAPTTRAKPRS